jgi:hypothetical protein
MWCYIRYSLGLCCATAFGRPEALFRPPGPIAPVIEDGVQIIVLGAHRSGTSLVTRLVNLLGAYVGREDDALQAAEDNPKGFWERRDTVSCNDMILAAAGCSWDQLAGWSFDRGADLHPPPEAAPLLSAAIEDLDGHRPWVLKDPRLCLTLPYWRSMLDRPVAVVVARDPCEIATSLRRRNNVSLNHALAIYEYSAVGVLANAHDLPTVRVSYAEVLADPPGAARRLLRDLSALGVTGLHEADEAAVREFVDESLYRSRPAENAARELLTPHLEALDAALRGLPSPPPERLRPSSAAVSEMEVYRASLGDRAHIATLEHDLEVARANAAAELASARAAMADHLARLEDAHRQLVAVSAERDHVATERDRALTERDQFRAELDRVVAERDTIGAHLDAILRSRYWRMGQRALAVLRAVGVKR